MSVLEASAVKQGKFLLEAAIIFEEQTALWVEVLSVKVGRGRILSVKAPKIRARIAGFAHAQPTARGSRN